MEEKTKSWKDRRAWLINENYSVTAEEYIKVRPGFVHSKCYRPDAIYRGSWHPALCFARNRTIEELGKYVDVNDGGYCVRTASRIPGQYLIVQGPPDSQGRLPDWASVEKRKRVPTDDPNVFELVEGE